MGEGRKERRGKLRYDLMPPRAFEKIVEVLTYGAEKYTVFGDCTCNIPSAGHTTSCASHKVLKKGDNNWKYVDDPENTYYAAALRHMEKDRQGEVYDKESGLTHRAMAATNMIFLLEYLLEERLSHAKENDR